MMKQSNIDPIQTALISMIERVENTKTAFTEGSPQYSLQKNRLQALRIALALVTDPLTLQYRHSDLAAAEAPIVSLISKSEKARQKLDPHSWQYSMLSQNIEALNHVLPILLRAIQTEQGGT